MTAGVPCGGLGWRAAVTTLLAALALACGGPSSPSVDAPVAPPARDIAAADATRLAAAQVAAVRADQSRAVVGRTTARASARSHAADAAGAAIEVASRPARQVPEQCSYRTYQWSTVQRRAVNRRSVSLAYADVSDEQRSPEDPRCTVCSEDQVRIDPAEHGWPDVAPFEVCWAYARDVERALTTIADDGTFRLLEVTGYRPGQTRGAIVDGNRTEWSNHSFGTAVDINADFNGLYRNCNVLPLDTERIASCTLGVGGAWRPDAQPEVSVVRDGAVYRAFVDDVGWRWGGEIPGNTKDLMHFSLTGY